MGFWSKIKEVFSKKEEVKEELPKEENNEPQLTGERQIFQEGQHKREYLEDLCEFCKEPIGDARRKRISGKIMHKKCFKEHYNKLRNAGKII